MLPAVSATTCIPRPINVIYVLPIRVVDEIVAIVDVYVVVASPTRIPSPASAPGCPHRHSNPEGDRHPSGVVAGWGVSDGRIWIGRRTIYHSGVIAGDIDNVRTRLLNHQHLLVFYDLGLDLLLLG